MVKQSVTVPETMYPIIQKSEGFSYTAPAPPQFFGPSPDAGGASLVSYPYMQYGNPNASRFAPMGTLTFQDRTDIMNAMGNLVLDSMAYEAALQRKVEEEKAAYYQDVAAVVNDSAGLKKLSPEFERINPVKAADPDKVVYTQNALPPKVVRKGTQDIVIPQTQTVVRDVDDGDKKKDDDDDEDKDKKEDEEGFTFDVRRRIMDEPPILGILLAVAIVLAILYYAARRH